MGTGAEEEKEAEKMEGLRERLGARGGHMTRQRTAVYGYLRGAGRHPTAEEVYNGVKRDLPRISLATVYKNLESLVECGLAAKVAGGGAARYESRTDHHYHTRCLVCGEMTDVEPGETLAGLVSGPHGFRVERLQVELLGRCDGCPG